MQNKTLTELRTLARKAGLKGYSTLSKQELISRLKNSTARAKPATQTRKKNSKPKAPAKSKTAGNRPHAAAARSNGAGKSVAPSNIGTVISEQTIESAKFQMAPPGVKLTQGPVLSDLHEDIEKLMQLNESVLCLLPQKPGVIHAYWMLTAGTDIKFLRLRLCVVMGESIELIDEIDVPSERGYRYFQVPENIGAKQFLAQLGRYDSTGKFVTAIRRGIARIPSLYASGHTDRSWWISEEEFLAMYVRAGGAIHDKRAAWPGTSTSSRIK